MMPGVSGFIMGWRAHSTCCVRLIGRIRELPFAIRTMTRRTGLRINLLSLRDLFRIVGDTTHNYCCRLAATADEQEAEE